MYIYIILHILAWVVGVVAALVLILHLLRSSLLEKTVGNRRLIIPFLVIVLALIVGMYAYKTYPPNFAMPAFMKSMAPGSMAPDLPLVNAFNFFMHQSKFERVANIARNPNDVPAAITRTSTSTVEINITAKEVLAEIAPNISFNYWTFDGTVPGPMLRVREGDIVYLTLANDPTSLHAHSIDLHAVIGPGGGAKVLSVMPGESKTLKWKALHPGLYIYHCATMNVSTHNAHGQYGLILVEPEEGLPKVDKEFYLVQGELYTIGGLGRQGLAIFDSQALLDGNPSYVTFNGRVSPDEPEMDVKRGETVRVFVGNGGINLISSFHIIGTIFDTVYPEAAMGDGSPLLHNVQTTLVPPGGASIVEFTAKVPGTLTVVDHALARLNKGAWALINVTGEPNPEVYQEVTASAPATMPQGADMR
jgi:nitrite reductase (NO-forming)